MKKKLLSIILCGALAVTTLAGCGGSGTSDKKTEDVTLTFMTNKVGVAADKLKETCEEFTKETGIKVEFSAPGKNYEDLMKAKMASKELPDLWTTHGWSVARYGEYLRPLNDQPFISKISPLIKPVITAENKDIYALPVDMDVAGIVYNVDALNKAGVNPDELKTWADFEKGLEKIKNAGMTPIHIGGKDSWTIGQYFDWVAPSFYVTNDAKNDIKALKDGSFDWNKWGEVAGLMKSWNEKGYFNVDSLTSDYATATKLLGEGKVAFEFYGNYAMGDALKTSPDAKLGFMPIPAKDASDKPTLIAGEDIAIGVNKDTKHEEAALKLLNYFAKEDVVKNIATASALPSGLEGITADTGMAKPFYEKYKDVKTMPYFDRAFLPNGMWDDMCTGGASILAKEADGVQKAINQMKTSYDTKMKQK